MKRKEFLKSCGYACLGANSIGVLLQSCVSSKMITAQISGENLIVPLIEFEQTNKEATSRRDYIIVQNDQLNFPIYVFRFSEQDYSVLYLSCTHQGTELNAYGDKLVCPSHGSEFDNRGNATNGPAALPLKSFPVTLDNQNILISLK